MKILVTGGGGFAGRYISNYLAEAGHSVTATYRSGMPNPEVQGVKYVYADLSKPLELAGGFEAIVHTAVSKSGQTLSMEEYVKNNIDPARNLVSFAREQSINTIIYFSTRNIYGQVREDIVTEDTDVINADKYGQTKYIAEQIFREASDLNTIGFRTPGIIGPNAHDVWLVHTVEKMLRNEPLSISDFNTKNMAHIEDISRFIFRLLKENTKEAKFKYNVVNLACKDSINNQEIIDIIKKRTGSKSDITVHKPDAGLFVLDSSRALEMGFEPMKPAEIVNRYLDTVLI